LRGEARLKQLLEKRTIGAQRLEAFTVSPEVIINNQLSERFTVIEVAGRDRTGLLYDLTSTLSDLSLDIASAHITTFGEKAVDVFYVTDLTGKKVDSENRQKTIAGRLTAVLSGSAQSATSTSVARK
jgi:[protein-PII] uridylyltransferase